MAKATKPFPKRSRIPQNESSMQTTEVDCSDKAAQTSCIVRTDETTQTTTEVAEVACAQQMTQTDRVDCSDEAAQTSCIARTDETTQTTADKEINVEPGERTGHRPEAKNKNDWQGPYVTHINKAGTVIIQGGASQVVDDNERSEQLRREVKTADELKGLRTQLTELMTEFKQSRAEGSTPQSLSGNTQSLDPEEVRIRLDREFSVLKSQISGLLDELSTLENKLREERQQLEVSTKQQKQEQSSDDELTTDCRTITIGTGTDSREPWITSMVVDVESGRVYMVDNYNDKILILTLSSLQVVYEKNLRLKPWVVALLSDQHVLVVTSFHEKRMVLIDIEDSNTPVKEVKTLRRYLGVAAGSDGNLVVSCIQDGDGEASVDIITLEGKPVRTVLSASQALPELKRPRYLCVQGSKAFVSDSKSDCVFCLDLDQGRLTDTLTHPQLKKPFQVCTDSAGNLYVVSSRGVCVLKKMTNALAFEPRVDVRHQALVDLETPRCVSVTDTQLLVSWEMSIGGPRYSVLKVYNFT
ncbi:uncharacterized protein [Littorina saxatilis]|uniref:uncharacterized protein n=1 Tax=Littorina saxatilis TaxID=31220 RepID=UPI0038B66A4F